MSYINGGVLRTSDMEPIPSKAQLKALVKEDPYFVHFYSTADMGEQFSGTLNKLPVGLKLSVCGPDPYKNRRWYATIERKPNDQVKCT